MKIYKSALVIGLLTLMLAAPAFAQVGIELSIGTPPPAPIVEAVPVSPGPTDLYAWRPGYWRWIDERHVWVPGHWAKRPHPGAEWESPKWDHHDDGYHFHEGHWK